MLSGAGGVGVQALSSARLVIAAIIRPIEIFFAVFFHKTVSPDACDLFPIRRGAGPYSDAFVECSPLHQHDHLRADLDP